MQTRSLALLLALALPGVAAAQLFTIPMRTCTLTDRDVPSIAPNLLTFSRQLKAAPALGNYDWAFPEIYEGVTAQIYADILAGKFRDANLMRDEISQFYEVYAVNANAWLCGGRPESQWAMANTVSRALHGGAATPANTPTKALGTVIASMYAHIIVDLPRALFILRHSEVPMPTLGHMRSDFWTTNNVFPPVTRRVLGVSRITPAAIQAVYNWLPRVVQRVLSGGMGINAFIAAIREIAWARLLKWTAQENWYVPGTDYRPEVFAMGIARNVTPLTTVPCGGFIGAPGAARRGAGAGVGAGQGRAFGQ